MQDIQNKNPMQDRKSIIDTYTTIYYVDIVVANKYTTLEELQELYEFSNEEELTEDIMKSDCSASRCRRKSDGKACILIKHNCSCKIKGVNKHLDLINTVAHEAGHAVLDIYEYIGQDICNCSPEPFCYLLGYIAECTYKTLTKK